MTDEIAVCVPLVRAATRSDDGTVELNDDIFDWLNDNIGERYWEWSTGINFGSRFDREKVTFYFKDPTFQDQATLFKLTWG